MNCIECLTKPGQKKATQYKFEKLYKGKEKLSAIKNTFPQSLSHATLMPGDDKSDGQYRIVAAVAMTNTLQHILRKRAAHRQE